MRSDTFDDSCASVDSNQRTNELCGRSALAHANSDRDQTSSFFEPDLPRRPAGVGFRNMNTSRNTLRGISSLAGCALCALLTPVSFGQLTNDGCADAIAIAGHGVTPYTTVGATTDGLAGPACLFFSVSQIYNDVWYCWTASASGIVSIDVCGSSFDTKLAVYADCTPCADPSTIIACNDDSCALHSKVTFIAEAGHGYTIRVGGYAATGSGTGNITIASGALAEITNPANGHRYLAFAGTTWTASEAFAVLAGSHLVTIDDQAENDWIQANFGALLGVDRRIWIGINDYVTEGQFVWSSGDPVAYTNWNGGEPNNGGAGEDATELLGSNGRWNDLADSGAGLAHLAIIELEPTAPACAPDFDGDGFVAGSDLAVILSNWGGGGTGDLDGDNLVGGSDLATMLSAWGACP